MLEINYFRTIVNQIIEEDAIHIEVIDIEELAFGVFKIEFADWANEAEDFDDALTSHLSELLDTHISSVLIQSYLECTLEVTINSPVQFQ